MTLRYTSRAFPIALLRARETFMSHLRPVIAGHGCTEQQWRVLRTLHEAGPCDATALAAKSCLLTPSMTRIIRSLEERGLVTRRPDAQDSRRLEIRISDSGRELIDLASPAIEAVYERLETAYGRKKMETLLDMLEELADVAEAQNAQAAGQAAA